MCGESRSPAHLLLSPGRSKGGLGLGRRHKAKQSPGHFSSCCSTPVPNWRRAAAWPALTIHGHLIYLGGVVLLNVSQDADVVILHKVDGYTFSAVSARPADSVEAERRREWSHLGEG